MSTLIIWLFALVISLFVLIKAAAYFTDSAESIGLFFKIPAFVVGATIVAIGTSLPELAASIFAVLKNSSEIVIGNIVGSNIANIFFVLGFAALFGRKIIKIKYKMKIHLFFLVGSAILLAVTIWNGFFTLIEAFLFLVIFLLYLIYILKSRQVIKTKPGEAEPREIIWKDFIILVISALFIYIGAKYTVESIINLSSILSIGKEVIAASAIALGTSLPELVVSIVAAKKGKFYPAMPFITGGILVGIALSYLISYI